MKDIASAPLYFSDLVLYGREPDRNIRDLYRAQASGVEILMDGGRPYV
jgi:hypothetical protein